VLISANTQNTKAKSKVKAEISERMKERKLLKRASSSDNLLTAAHFIAPLAKPKRRQSRKEKKKFDMPSGFCVDFFVRFSGLLICSLCCACKLIFGI